MSAIRRSARRLGEKFQPEKIILFGSYAKGTQHEDSDVDLLVVMEARNEIDASVRLTLAFDSPFSLDLIVRTPKKLQRELEDENWFLREVMATGKVIYEKTDKKVGSQGRSRPRRRRRRRG